MSYTGKNIDLSKYEKYGKEKEAVELSKVEVELGLIDELKSDMKKANQGAMKAIDMANAAKKPAEESLKLNNQLLKNFEGVLSKVKELGIKPAEKEVQNQITQVKENIKTINQVLDALYKI